MFKFFTLLFSVFFISMGVLGQQDISKLKGPRPVIDPSKFSDDAFEKGIISFKFNQSVEAIIGNGPVKDKNGNISFGIPAVDAIMREYNATEAFLTFGAIRDKNGLFTQRHKDWGFHLWYHVKFSLDKSPRKIIAALQELKSTIDIAEFQFKVEQGEKPLKGDKVNFVPNDPRFNQQWHYNNTGQNGGTPDADIDLPEAWDIETGKPEVIVGVVDGGIQITHPDIAANMWPGNGFNFITNSPTLTGEDHGTHTSGTIAAVNNNGIGVSGIAGGDGTANSGVRLMSLQVFSSTGSATNFAAVYPWSADRGAAVSQNSWNYTTAGTFNQSVLDGIDYFIAHGGGAVMTGGVVIFSGGNNGVDEAKYPAFYPPTIAVASSNNKDIKANYSNFGAYIDITAPGGEQNSDTDPRGVLSTVSGSSYAFFQGTSMACPHVSGVAALILSRAQGVLTAAQLRSILLAQVDNIYPLNPTYTGKLGSGRLNAFKCLQAAALLAGNNNLDVKISAITEPTNGLWCKVPFNPMVKIRNIGSDTITSVQVGAILDGLPVGTLTTINNLSIASFKESAPIVLPFSLSPSVGVHTLKVFTINPNGRNDQRPINDTTTVRFTIAPALNLPYAESFQTTPFPPANGSAIINADNDITWARRTTAGNPGTASIWLNNFDYNAAGAIDIYRTPKINTSVLDSLTLTFNVAYQPYPGSSDSLSIVISPDCGNTWLRTSYSKGGAGLSTVAGTNTATFAPTTASQWRTEKITLKDFCSSNLSSVMIGFQNYNDFGNNVFVDGINITGYASNHRNISLNSISLPKPALCVNNFTPEITFRNDGLDTLTSVKLNYQVDGAAPSTITWTGSLTKCNSTTVSLPAGTAAVGTHIIKAFASEPNGLDDQFTSNDTLSKIFSIFSSTATPTPIFEGFEDAIFPRANWGVQNVNGGTTWQKATNSARTGTASMWINNPNAGNANNAVDYFISPLVANNSNIDSMFVDFDLSYKSGSQYPGSTVFALDTLEVLATFDCGATFTSVWKKWGDELQTVNDPNYTSTSSFVPTIKDQWKSKRIYLTPIVGANNFQLYFAAKSNKLNNIWIDNINISSKTLPQRLKDQGYLIYPNPFNSSFLIHHSAIEPPVDLQSAQVFNSGGQLVWEREYNGKAERQITVDLKNMSNGVYILKMIYTNKTVIERIVKN